MAKKPYDLPDLDKPSPNTAPTSTSSDIEKAPGFWTNVSDILAKLVVPLFTVGVGVWQFQAGQNFNQEQEFKRRIWEKRLEAYSQIGDITGQLIGTTNDSIQFDSLSRYFSQIYWGKLPLVQDDSVEIKMKRFKEEVENFKHKEATVEDLETKGYYLMQACQRSLKNTGQR